MKLQYHWGWNIAILFGGFVILILSMVGMSVRQKIDLVSDDYYAMELVHQQKIDKIKRANSLVQSVSWKLEDQFLKISFPENFDKNSIAGNIILYCPADSRRDRVLPIELKEDHSFRIPLSAIQAGRYRLQIDWASQEETYWNEGVINIGG